MTPKGEKEGNFRPMKGCPPLTRRSVKKSANEKKKKTASVRPRDFPRQGVVSLIARDSEEENATTKDYCSVPPNKICRDCEGENATTKDDCSIPANKMSVAGEENSPWNRCAQNETAHQ